jgi:hypothetical protein
LVVYMKGWLLQRTTVGSLVEQHSSAVIAGHWGCDHQPRLFTGCDKQRNARSTGRPPQPPPLQRQKSTH